MDIASVDVGQVDDLLKDFDVFLEARVLRFNSGRELPGCRQAYNQLEDLYHDIEKQQDQQSYLDLEAAVNFVVACVEDAAYKTGFNDGIRFLIQLIKGGA